MSKIIYFILLVGLVITAAAVINISNVTADADAKFIPVSVLSKKQANYRVDTTFVTIPVVSADILEDKVHDAQGESSIQIIRYTSLPVENQGTANQDNDNTESTHQSGPPNNQGNNGNAASNQNMNNSNDNAGSENNSSDNGKGKDNKPDKGNVPEDKGNTPETAPGKNK